MPRASRRAACLGLAFLLAGCTRSEEALLIDLVPMPSEAELGPPSGTVAVMPIRATFNRTYFNLTFSGTLSFQGRRYGFIGRGTNDLGYTPNAGPVRGTVWNLATPWELNGQYVLTALSADKREALFISGTGVKMKLILEQPMYRQVPRFWLRLTL